MTDFEKAIEYCKKVVSSPEYGENMIHHASVCLDALQSQAECETNEPLTIDELRKMDGEPVWVECEQCIDGGAAWCILEPCDKKFVVFVSRSENRYGRFGGMFTDYGKTWLAYRHKKEST